MNNSSPPNNPSTVIRKIALRILSITLLSFLFIPEGWGEKDESFTAGATTMTDNVTLNYNSGGWTWIIDNSTTSINNFNGMLKTTGTTGDTPFSSDYSFIIAYFINGTPSELILDNFHFSGKNGVFRIEAGAKPVKITAANACTLESRETGANVITVPAGRTLTLDGGSEGITIRYPSSGLLNKGTTTLSGHIKFIPSVGTDYANAIKNQGEGRLNIDENAVLTTADGASLTSISWHFKEAPAAGSTVIIKKVEGKAETQVATFTADGQSTDFLILSEAGASYTVYVKADDADAQEIKQMGKKQTGSDNEYTNTFAVADNPESPDNPTPCFYGVLTAHPTVSTFNEFKIAIESASADPAHPTKITLGADIDFAGWGYTDLFFRLNGKHIEIDGAGYTLTPGTNSFLFDGAGSAAGSLKLTNMTVDCNNVRGSYSFISGGGPGTTITLGKGFRMVNGISGQYGYGSLSYPYGVMMSNGTLTIEEDAEITGSTDENGAAIGVTSGGTLILKGGKIHGNSGFGLYLFRNETGSYPEVRIESVLPNGSLFEGVCLVDYENSKKVITTDYSYTITPDDLAKFELEAFQYTNPVTTFYKGFKLVLDDSEKTIKLQLDHLLINDVKFDDEEEGYAQPATKPVIIWNTTGQSIFVSIALTGEHSTKFTIMPPNTMEITSSAGSKDGYSIQPNAGLPAGTYTATIALNELDRDYNILGTYTAEVSFTVKLKTPDPIIPDPDPIIPDYVYYQVTLPHLTGVTTDPVAGTYLVSEGDAFRFKVTLQDDYNLSTPEVKAGDKVLQPDTYGYYLIPNVWHDQTVTITGITLNPVDPPSANAGIDEPVRVWAEGHTLYIHTATRETIRLYAFTGRLLKQVDNAGRIAITGLPEGNYVIRVGDRTWKVVL